MVDKNLIEKILQSSKLARVGNVEGARKMLDQLRKTNVAFDPDVTAWIILGEGIVDRTQNFDDSAIGKFRRALAISEAIRDPDLTASCHAWLAAAIFGKRQVAESFEHASEAVRIGRVTLLHSALARAYIVIADCLFFCAREERARFYYKLARDHAIRDGDISMQSMAIYNCAANEVCLAEFEECTSGQCRDLRFVELSINSSENLERAIQSDSLAILYPLLNAQLAVLKKDWGEAIRIFESKIPDFELERESGWIYRIRADLAYALANEGRFVECGKILSELEGHNKLEVAFDDLYVANIRIGEAFSLMKDSGKQEDHYNIARDYLARYRSQQEDCLLKIGESMKDC